MINNVCCINKMQELFCNVKRNILFNNNNKLPKFDNDKTCIENWIDWLITHYPHIDNYKTFKEVVAEDGFYLTNYKEDQPINEYSSFKIASFPLNADLSGLYEIEADKDKAYKEAVEKFYNKNIE